MHLPGLVVVNVFALKLGTLKLGSTKNGCLGLLTSQDE